MNSLSSNQEYFEKTFKNLELTEEIIEHSEFEECQFIGCDLSSSQFKHCRFINCDFIESNLSLLNLSYSRLSGVGFRECKMVGIDWTSINWPSYHADFELSFKHCVLNDNSFFGLTLNNLHLEECKMHDVDFREGDFTESNITYCDLTGAQFMKSNLQGCDFTESSNYAINPFENNIKEAKFSRWEAFSLLECMGIELVD
ncbi:mcbG-like protein [Vibrio ishigakensis]|uniref:McbG-like protein n=1 Tax=Vibrio ishigakensis TaxID=1481914 RepID=A0A0B8P094_9VIBR|nr:pentapeptide repeat-containing protein [Vibrio ishigakensis]GAM56753.1 mcbG-like protein [Vibrio ishigakensis]